MVDERLPESAIPRHAAGPIRADLDQNITGFRAEEMFGFNAEPYPRTGMVQKVLVKAITLGRTPRDLSPGPGIAPSAGAWPQHIDVLAARRGSANG